jgi:hypothetical protein
MQHLETFTEIIEDYGLQALIGTSLPKKPAVSSYKRSGYAEMS